MKNLLYKEFRLAINPLFYLVPLFGALILIPHWVYFVALSYVFFITISNIFATCKSQNDIGFSIMLPARKRDIIKARVISIGTIEMIHLGVAAVFGIINFKLMKGQNTLMDPNAAFFGFGFMMYGLFNLFFFPMYYKTGYKLGMPVIVGTAVALVFATGVEFFVKLNPWAHRVFDTPGPETVGWKLGALAVGTLFYLFTTAIAYRMSARRFERIDL